MRCDLTAAVFAAWGPLPSAEGSDSDYLGGFRAFGSQPKLQSRVTLFRARSRTASS